MYERSFSGMHCGRRINYTVRYYGDRSKFYYLGSVDGRPVKYTDPSIDYNEFFKDVKDFLRGESSLYKFE